MDDIITERSIYSQATCVIDVFGLFSWHHSMAFYTTRHWQTSGRLVQKFNVCTVWFPTPVIFFKRWIPSNFQIVLTLPMLRLLSSKPQGRQDFWKPSKPCHVGIHWTALPEYSQMNTHVPGFQSFFRIFASFCIGQNSYQQQGVNDTQYTLLYVVRCS